MTTPPERIEEVKTWFEANYLDGDAVQEGQMLASSECLDALITQQQSHHQELQKSREEERERIKRYIQKRRKEVNIFCAGTGDIFVEEIMKEIDQSELDQPNK